MGWLGSNKDGNCICLRVCVRPVTSCTTLHTSIPWEAMHWVWDWDPFVMLCFQGQVAAATESLAIVGALVALLLH